MKDLGFNGSIFTWKNGQEGGRHVQERLDRFVANNDWKSMFDHAKVSHLGFWGSDHRALLLTLKPKLDWSHRCSKRKIEFRFEPWWMKEAECIEAISSAWQSHHFDGTIQSVQRGMRRCASELRMWSQVKFGFLPKRIRNVQHELELLYKKHQTNEVIRRTKQKEMELDNLLANEEYYWQQRARTDCLRGGDRNTKFFHAKASQRKAKKQIEGLEDSHGRWLTQQDGIAEVIETYFQDIFKSSHPLEENLSMVLDCVEPCITPAMSEILSSRFSMEEVKAAMFEMGSLKAPGPDGFHAAFFQRNWAVVGGSVTDMCLNILNGDLRVDELNTTLICLIPKVKNPRKVSDFRPISLCNVLYKLITKTIANRLKNVLGSIIS